MKDKPEYLGCANWCRWRYLLALAAILVAFAILVFPWGASAYHLERAARTLEAGGQKNAASRGRAAEHELQKAVGRYPANAQAFRLLARAYELQEKQAAEVEALAQYVALRSKDPLGYWELAVACEQLTASKSAQVAGQPCGTSEETRQETLVRLWRQAGQSAADFVRAGESMRKGENLPEAAAFYQRALLLDPESADAWYGLARLHLARNEHEEALEALAQVVELSSDVELVALAHDQRGQILAEVGRWVAASQELGQAVALDPDHGHYHLRYGWYLFKAGRSLQEARAELEKAADLLPTSPWPRLRLADLAFAEQDYAQMLVHAQQASEIRPNLASGWVSQGRALRFLGQLKEAEETLRHALGLAPANATAHDELAQVLKRLERLDEAIEEWEQAVALAPKNAWYRLRLGNAYYANGQLMEAAEAYHRVLELDPDNTAARQALDDLGQ